MKKLLVFASVAIAASFASCVSEKNEDGDVTTVKVDFNRSEDFMEEIASIQGFRLPDDPHSTPATYFKAQWKGDSLYILDIFKSKGLYLFNDNGELLNCYNKRGHGPDEFLGLSDFILTEDGIILLDTYAKSNCIYLDSDFKFLKKTEAEEKAAHFAKDSKGGFWYDRGNVAYGDNKDKLVYTTSSGKRTSVLKVPSNLENITFVNTNSFTSLGGDTVVYFPVLEPCLYRCVNGKATKILELDFGEKWPEFDNGDTSVHPFTLMKRVEDEGKIYRLNMESDGEYLVFSFTCGDKSYILYLKQEEPESYRLFHMDNSQFEKFGSLLTVHNDQLTFGGDGKIVIVELKSI